jgi:hypothetical protein
VARHLRFLIVILLTASVVSLSAQGRREWVDLYRDGIDLVAKQEWNGAEAAIRMAMKLGPPSGRNQIKRTFGSDDYFPEYYLGIILLNTKRPAAAHLQFQIARKRGINLRDREFARLPEYEARAKELADGEANARAAVEAREERFAQLLRDAERHMASSQLDAAEKSLDDARSLNVNFKAVEPLAEQLRLARAASRLRDALNRNPRLPELRRLLDEYGSTGVPLDEIRRRIEIAETTERRDVAERAAMVAFYSGNYTQAVSALNDAEQTLALSTRGLFYRAVTLATQATRGKTVNETMLQRARQAWQEANKAPESFKADLRYVSPEILRQLRGR